MGRAGVGSLDPAGFLEEGVWSKAAGSSAPAGEALGAEGERKDRGTGDQGLRCEWRFV